LSVRLAEHFVRDACFKSEGFDEIVINHVVVSIGCVMSRADHAAKSARNKRPGHASVKGAGEMPGR
jgi:hypothetical protein